MSIAFDCAVEFYRTSVIQVSFGYQFIILNKSKNSIQEHHRNQGIILRYLTHDSKVLHSNSGTYIKELKKNPHITDINNSVLPANKYTVNNTLVLPTHKIQRSEITTHPRVSDSFWIHFVNVKLMNGNRIMRKTEGSIACKLNQYIL